MTTLNWVSSWVSNFIHFLSFTFCTRSPSHSSNLSVDAAKDSSRDFSCSWITSERWFSLVSHACLASAISLKEVSSLTALHFCWNSPSTSNLASQWILKPSGIIELLRQLPRNSLWELYLALFSYNLLSWTTESVSIRSVYHINMLFLAGNDLTSFNVTPIWVQLGRKWCDITTVNGL